MVDRRATRLFPNHYYSRHCRTRRKTHTRLTMAAIFPPRWSWRMFGVFEPLTCLISGLMISMPAGDSIFLQSLFPAALRGASVAADPGSWWTYAVLGVAAVQDPAASS